MVRRMIVVSLFSLPILLFCSGFSTLVAPGKGWQDLPVELIVDENGHPSVEDGEGGLSRTIEAINSPSTGWNSALSGVIEARAGNTGGGRQGDGTPTMNFTGSSACTGNCVAVTFPLKNGRGILVDADIYVNDQVDFTSTGESGCLGEIFLEATMVHETGHALGLGHSGLRFWATMYFAVSICSNYQATIAGDDARGIRYIY